QGEGVRPRLLFSADDQYLAFVDPAGTSWLWKLPDVRLLKMSGIFLGQDYPIAAFSRNSQFLAFSKQGGVVDIVDVKTAKKKCSLSSGLERVTALAFAEDNSLFFLASNGAVHKWDISLTKEKERFEAPSGTLGAFSPDLSRVAVVTGGGEGDGDIDIMEIAGRERTGPLRGPHGDVVDLAFIRDKHCLVAAADRSALDVWDIRTRRKKFDNIPIAQVGRISLCGKQCALVDRSGRICVCDIETGSIAAFRSAEGSSRLVFGAEGRAIAISSNNVVR